MYMRNEFWAVWIICGLHVAFRTLALRSLEVASSNTLEKKSYWSVFELAFCQQTTLDSLHWLPRWCIVQALKTIIGESHAQHAHLCTFPLFIIKDAVNDVMCNPFIKGQHWAVFYLLGMHAHRPQWFQFHTPSSRYWFLCKQSMDFYRVTI